jgi:hypothetical protein
MEPQPVAASERTLAPDDHGGGGLSVLPASAGVRWRQALPVAALGGALSLLLAIIPFAVFGPAFMAGGAFAVALYRRRVKDKPGPGTGAQIGAASGTFGFLFSALPMLMAFLYHADDLRKAMLDSVSQLTSRGYDPDKIGQVLELLKTREGLAFFVSFGLFVMFVVFVAAGSIGGAGYSAWLRKRMRG